MRMKTRQRPNHSINILKIRLRFAKHSQHHCCDIMGFKAYPYSPIRFSMLAHLTYYLGIGIHGIRRYDNNDNWNLSVVNESGMAGSDPITYVTCCHHVTLQ